MNYLKRWLKSTGHTYDTGAQVLGVSRSQLANYVREKSRTNGKPTKLPASIRDKCEAISAERTAYLAHLGRQSL